MFFKVISFWIPTYKGQFLCVFFVVNYRYYKHVTWGRDMLNRSPDMPLKQIYVPPFRRGIFTVGLVCRYFDFKNPEVIGDVSKDDGQFTHYFPLKTTNAN